MPAKQNSRAEKRAQHGNHITQKPLLWIGSIALLVLIFVTFIGAPIVSKMGAQGAIHFGSYAGKPIEYYPGNYLAKQQQYYADQYASQNQGDSSNTTMVLYQVWRRAFEETVVHFALLHAADRAGLQVTDAYAARDLKAQYDQQGDGLWDQFLQNSDSIAQQKALDNHIAQMRHQQVATDLISGARTSSGEADFLAGMSRNERSFSYVAYSAADYPESEIVSYGQDHAKLFEQMQLSRITIKSSKREAEDVRAQLEADPTRFGELARTLSTDGFAEQGGEMGMQSYFVLQQDFDDTTVLNSIFDLKKGELSPVVQTSFGWVIYRCDEEAVAPDFSSAQTLALISSYINRYEKGRIIDYLTERADFFRTHAQEVGMASAASDAGISLQTTVSFPINYGNSPLLKTLDSNTEGIFSKGMTNETFLTNLFSLKKGEVSEVLTLDNYVIVAEVNEEVTLEDSQLDQMKTLLPYYLQRIEQEELYRYYMSSDQLQDDFASAFQRLYLSNSN